MAEVGPYLLDGLLKVGGEVLSRDEERVVAKQRLEIFALAVEVTNGIVGAILSSILSRELEAVGGTVDDGNRVVNEIDVFGGPLLVVLDEPVVEVASRKSVSAVLIVT